MRSSAFTRLAAAAIACTVTALAPAPASAFSGLVVFGDSLSDNGNLLTLTSALNLPGIGSVPAAPYWNGRFSNGPVAVEVLASGLGLTSAQVEDRAYGGATSGLLNAHFGTDEINAAAFGGNAAVAAAVYAAAAPLRNTGVLSQLASFSAAHGGVADGNALYVVWAGANDFLHASPADLANPATAGALIAGVVGNLTGTVQQLYTMGARHFLLPTLPDTGITPRLIAAGSPYDTAATALSFAFNGALLNAYGQLAKALPDEDFNTFKTFEASHAVQPLFTNTTDACTSSLTALASNCAGYMFFDDIHPTAATHMLLGQQMLAAVPEPASMLMLAVGIVGLLGWQRRQAN